jgi:hypothetical protein
MFRKLQRVDQWVTGNQGLRGETTLDYIWFHAIPSVARLLELWGSERLLVRLE